MTDDARRRVPSVSAVLDDAEVRALVHEHGHDVVVAAVRAVLDDVRRDAGTAGVPDPVMLGHRVTERLDRTARRRLRGVVNATGVVLHTNLGRAPLSDDAIRSMVGAAGPATVEYDLDAGRRASRGALAGRLLRDLVGAGDAMVVNNGAAALVLSLAVVASGRRVAVSRGELVEIGGSFRLPEIVEAAGVGLAEVGTTNRTRADDYDRALAHDDVVAVLRVHPSNFRVEGFAERPTPEALAEVAARHGAPFLHDVGSGLLHDDLPVPGGAHDEPDVRGALADGADLVVASGDKLLGGPQAGLLAGRADLVERCRRHPLARALRVDKLRLAALEATLGAYRRGAPTDLPTWRMLAVDPADLRRRAAALCDRLTSQGIDVEVVDVDGVVGGGSLPGVALPSVALALPDPDGGTARRLATGDPPVVGRVRDGRVLLDLRTVHPDDDTVLADRLSGD